MLVLSRRSSEKILFPSINAVVQVLSIKGGAVRLGIDAPPEVTILREELRDQAHVRADRIRPQATSFEITSIAAETD